MPLCIYYVNFHRGSSEIVPLTGNLNFNSNTEEKLGIRDVKQFRSTSRKRKQIRKYQSTIVVFH